MIEVYMTYCHNEVHKHMEINPIYVERLKKLAFDLQGKGIDVKFCKKPMIKELAQRED
ncbi:hypothetical protein [Thalassobacillus devorans]|uniref:hypothetical protein n=1 Tax=Thalassobacillus devorans TaxID=279813 RepID=UPI001592F017|nr:hypothetical protein [Thalassobacillus devorans]